MKLALIGLLAAAIVLGCGGGGNDSEAGGTSGSNAPAGAEEYVAFQGNSNGNVILDGASSRFSVKRSDQKLVYLATRSELNGVLVSNAGAVTLNGAKIGDVVLNGGVAQLACSGPAPNYGLMTITVSGSTWKYSCASNSGVQNPGDSGGSSSNSGSDAEAMASVRSNCATLEKQSSLAWQIRNSCNERINVSFCFENPDPTSWASGLRCSNSSYGSDSANGGSVVSISSPGNTRTSYQYRIFACAANSKFSIPSMSNQGATGACK